MSDNPTSYRHLNKIIQPVVIILLIALLWYQGFIIAKTKEFQGELVNLREEDLIFQKFLGHALEGLEELQSVDGRTLVVDDEKSLVLLLTSFKACSTCRLNEIRAWEKVVEKNIGLQVVLVVSEGEPLLTHDVTLQISANKVTLPVFLDLSGRFLKNLELDPSQTPASIIVNARSLKILDIHIAKEGEEHRSDLLREKAILSGGN